MEFNIINEESKFKLGNILSVFKIPESEKEIVLFSLEGFEDNDESNLQVAYINTDSNGYDYIEEINDDKILKFDPSYIRKKPATHGGCYIATCVYRSYDCPEVWALRRYRDNILAKNWYGRVFIHIYYAISPTMVRLFGKKDWFRNFWQKKLDKKVEKLQSNGVENTPYQDKEW